MNVKCGDETDLVESPEHVPLLITPSAASKHQKPSVAATTINIPTNVTNGNGLIDSGSDQQQWPLQISPVVLSSSTPALVMRSRLNQYKAGGGNFTTNMIVNFDDNNGTTVNKTTSAKNKNKKKKKSVNV